MRGCPLFRAIFAIAVVSLLGAPLGAEELPAWLAKFAVHGYISQAYAVSQEHQIFGIPTNGTADLRDAALQLRYDPNKENTFLVQIRQERLGESPQAENTRAVDLDSAFYQRRFGDRLSIKAGRIPLPLGIFNESRAAGTTFPFYRPPNEFYVRQYTSKTVDGALASLALDGPRGWSFNVDGYGGRWKLDPWGSGYQADATHALGGQVWLNSPWPGKRIGGGAYRCTVVRRTGTKVDYLMYHASIQADFDRILLASEYIGGDLGSSSRYNAYYAQAGYELTRKLSVHGRAAVATIGFPRATGRFNTTLSNDWGVAVNYAFHPTLLLKLEGHTNEGLLREDVPQNFVAAPSSTRYFIATVVATF